MHRNPPTTSRGRALAALRAVRSIALALTLLLVVAGPVAASAVESRRHALSVSKGMEGLPTLSSVTPWSARCYTDTCVGFRVTFDSGHAVTLGHAGDNPDHWAIFDSDRLTDDEATFAAATVSALARRDLPALAAAYPDLPAWFMDALAAYVATARPVEQLWLPLVLR